MSISTRDSAYHTYGDYLIWSRTWGDELIDGVAYVKEPPSPTWSHQAIVGELFRQIANARGDAAWRVQIAPSDVRLPKSDEPDDLVDTVVQPDVFIISDLTKLDERGTRGAPDWLAEVLSPSTARYDQVKKLPVYARAGVLEVWLINPADLTVAIHHLEDGRYGRPNTLKLEGLTPITAVPGIVIDWGPVVKQLAC